MKKTIRQIRREKEITQKDMANYLGISLPAYSYKEARKKLFSIEEGFKICKFFEVKFTDIDWSLKI